MTIEEKAKAYDLALETASGYCKNNSLINPMNVIPKIFPQILSENIGKEVISILRQYGKTCDKEKDPCGILDDCISWVEDCMKSETDMDKIRHEVWMEYKDKHIEAIHKAESEGYIKGQKDGATLALTNAIEDLEILYEDWRNDGCVEEASGIKSAINTLEKKLEVK